MRKFLLLLSCFVATPVAAGEANLSGDAIKTTLSGSSLALDTPMGTTVAVRIGHDGLMSGDAGTVLGSVLGAPKDRGRWWVVENKVCFKWFRWFDAEERCATISVEGTHLTWRRDDGDTGTATIVEQGHPTTKRPVIVAEEKKPTIAKKSSPAKSATETKQAVIAAVSAGNGNSMAQKSETQIAAASPTDRPSPPFSSKASLEKIATLHVPTPRPATRPQHKDPVALASVKPQFFTSSKTVAMKPHRAKVQVAAKIVPAKVQIAAKSPALKSEPNPFRVAGVDPTDVLNIRNGPSADFQTVGAIPPDSRGITITGPCQNDWCPVKHRLLVGWVNRRYLAEETAANTASASIPNYWDPAP